MPNFIILDSASEILATVAGRYFAEHAEAKTFEFSHDNPLWTLEKLKPIHLRFQAIAEALGIDFEQTGYTCRAAKADGKANIYSIAVAQVGGQPILSWGNTRTLLSDLKIQPTIEEVEGRSYFEFDLGDLGLLHVAMMLTKEAKEAKVDRAKLRQAFSKGTLGNLLSEAFIRPKALKELEPGDYLVTGYGCHVSFGRDAYHFTATDLDGNPLGTFKANTEISKKLITGPSLSPEIPGNLKILGVIKQTKEGKDIIGVEFKTPDDDSLLAELSALGAFSLAG